MIVLFRGAALLALLALGVAAAACGGDDGDDGGADGAPDGSEQTANEGRQWKGEYESGTGATIELFVPASDPALANFEKLRELVGAPAVVYGKVTAKNTGSAPDTGRFVTLTGADGDQLAEDVMELNFACAHAYRWSQAPGLSKEAIDVYTGLYNIDCRGATIAGPPIQPGETLTFYVAIEADAEPQFERVFAGLANEFKK